MAPTINDIAQVAGVTKSTVSVVLNNRSSLIKVSDATRDKIHNAARDLGYHPNAAARALSTKRTGQLGFILSDEITGGFDNVYFANTMSGVEKACRKRGYGLSVSLYNLSNIESFVMPPKVGQKAVDGLVLTGYVEADVVERFRQLDVPCVCIGDNVEISHLIPTFAGDIEDGMKKMLCHAARCGHQNIWYVSAHTRRSVEAIEKATSLARQDAVCERLDVEVILSPVAKCDYSAAGPLLDQWLACDPAVRPSLIICTDQTAVAMLQLMAERGLSCPDDLALVACGDSTLAAYATPPLTALAQQMDNISDYAVEVLINHIEKETPLTPATSRGDWLFELVARKSC